VSVPFVSYEQFIQFNLVVIWIYCITTNYYWNSWLSKNESLIVDHDILTLYERNILYTKLNIIIETNPLRTQSFCTKLNTIIETKSHIAVCSVMKFCKTSRRGHHDYIISDFFSTSVMGGHMWLDWSIFGSTLVHLEDGPHGRTFCKGFSKKTQFGFQDGESGWSGSYLFNNCWTNNLTKVWIYTNIFLQNDHSEISIRQKTASHLKTYSPKISPPNCPFHFRKNPIFSSKTPEQYLIFFGTWKSKRKRIKFGIS